MKIFTRWEILVYRKYINAPLVDPTRAPSLNLMKLLEIDVTVNDVRKTLGLPAAFVLHPDCKKQTALTGTLAFTKDSATVTGEGTKFIDEVSGNDYLYWNSGQSIARIADVEIEDGQLTLASAYEGQTVSSVVATKSSILDRGLSYVWADETPLPDDYLIPAWAATILTNMGYSLHPSDCA